MARKEDSQKRRPAEVARDRRNIARLYLKGVFQADIGEELGISQPMVSRDLKVIQKQWRVERVDDFNERKNIELAKVDNLELENWIAWKRSQEDAETKKMVRYSDGETHSQDEDKETDKKAVKRGSAKTRKEQSVKGQVGDRGFLKGIEWCIDKRWALLGMDAPKDINIHPDEIVIRYADRDNDPDAT